MKESLIKLEGFSPEKLTSIQDVFNDLPGVNTTLHKKGIVVYTHANDPYPEEFFINLIKKMF